MGGGVAILFSKNCIPCSYQVEEVIKGRLLKVVAQFENCSFIFICVYVPVNTLERMLFLDTLSNVLCNCNPDNSLLLGGILIALRAFLTGIMLNRTWPHKNDSFNY